MKKFFTLLSLAVLACASAIAAINWTNVDNLAKGATVVVSSKPAEANNICDGNDGTGWQAVADTHPYTHDWVLINLGESKTFTDMEIVWEASHCKEYSVYVSNEAIPYEEKTFTVKEAEGDKPAETITCNVINEAWLAANTPVKTGGDSSEAGYTENFNFDPAQKGQYILIYANEYNNFGNTYGMRIFDVKIANIEGRDEVSELKITQDGNAVAGGEAVTVSVVPVNKAGEELNLNKVEGLSLTANNEAVSISGGANGVYSVTANKAGEYTLTATATANGANVTGTMTLNVAYNWNVETNIATGKEIKGRVKADTENPNPPANAVNGNLETYYQYNGEWGGGDGWLLVDLGDEYMVSAIGAYYSTNAGGKCMFGYATDATEVYNKITADGTDYVWNFTQGWNFTNQLTRTANAITTQAFATPVVARYIVIKDADNPQGKPCVNEIYVSGVKRETSVATSIEVTASDNYIATETSVTFSAKVLDQYGAEMPDETVNYNVDGGAVINDNKFVATTTGTYTVTATSGDLETSIDIYVIADGNNTATADKVTLNGEPVNATGEVQIVTVPSTLTYTFSEPKNFTLINFCWEASCPADYTVTVTYANGTTTSVLDVSGRDFVGGFNPIDKVIGSVSRASNNANLNNVKEITLNITKKNNNHDDWAMRLFRMEAYTDGQSSAIDNIIVDGNAIVDVYNLQGVKVRSKVKAENALDDLPRGIYIVGGRKVMR